MPNDIEVGVRRQAASEVRPWSIDLLAEMDAGDSIQSATAALTDTLTGVAYPGGLTGGVAISGTIVTQTVTSLVAGHSYRLIITTNMGGSKLTASVLNLYCPY